MKTNITFKMSSSLILVSGLFIASSLLFSCKKDNTEPIDDSTPTTVESYLRFKHKVDNQAIEYDTVKYVNDFGNNFSIETIRYFISNIAFVKSNDDIVDITDVIYVDPRNEGYDQKKFKKAIPNGQYTAIQFTFGLDAIMNQTGMFNNFPEAAMEWPVMMGGGYHYMKLEGRYQDQASYNHFNFHTGPLDNNENYFQVELPMTLNVSNGAFDVTLSMEIQNWFKNPNSFDLSTISQGMMGDQTKQELVKNNGIDIFSVE